MAVDPAQVLITEPSTGHSAWTTQELYDTYWSGRGWTIDGQAPGPIVPPEQPPAGADGQPAVWLEVGEAQPAWTTPGLWVQTGLGADGSGATIWIEDGKP